MYLARPKNAVDVAAVSITLTALGCLLIPSAAHASEPPAPKPTAAHAPQPPAPKPAAAHAPQPLATPAPGFVDFNGYYDIREFSTLTVNILLNFPAGLRYFSLVNYQGAPARRDPAELEAFYTEQNLYWAPIAPLPLELSSQWVVAVGAGNDALRFGVVWRVSKTPLFDRVFQFLHLSYFVDFHAVQFDHLPEGYGGQIEHVYRLDILPGAIGDRAYLGGFTDHNVWLGGPAGTPTSLVVSELQLGIRIIAGLHVVAEARHNDYLPERQTGLGLGLEYLVPIVPHGA